MSDALHGLTMPPPYMLALIMLGLLASAVLYAVIRRNREGARPKPPLSTQALILEGAETAVARARARYGITLDYRIASILQVEQIFAKLSELRASSPELIDADSLSFVFGAYLGETIRLNYPGFFWQRDGAEVGFRLYGNETVCSPIDWCMRRLTECESANLWSEYEAITGSATRARSASAS
jgi:hypothetical protein